MFDARERFIRCREFLCWRLLWITGIFYRHCPPARPEQGNITIMRKIELFRTRDYWQRPAVKAAGQSTWLVAIEPDSPDHDKRTFECPRCQDVVVKVVKYK